MEIGTTMLAFLLVMARIGSFFVAMPILSMRQLPSLAKLTVVVVLSYMTMFWIPTFTFEATNFLSFGLLVAREVFLGIGLGWMTNIMFLSIQGAGDLVDFFVGLKMGASYDPITGASGSMYSNLFNWLGTILFFILNGHHYLLKGIVNSCHFIPIAEGDWVSFTLEGIVTVITNMFLLSVQLALPMCVILFLVDIILGLINRSVPQINVFILGMPIKLATSFIVMIFLIAGISRAIMWALDSVVQILNEAMQFMLM